jgi:hypothetical protein
VRALRIGLDVGRERVRAVLLQRGELRWHDEERIGADQSLDISIARLLARAPARGILPARVIAAVGPATAHVKRLPMLPTAGEPRALADALRLNTASFFLTNGVALRTSSVHFRCGAWWGAAYEQPALDAIADGCRRAGKRLEGCAPLVALLAHSYHPGHMCWHDAEANVDIHIDSGGCVDVRRSGRAVEGTTVGPMTAKLRAPLPGLDGDAGHRFAGAYAAALSSRHVPFFLRHGTSTRQVGAGRRRRTVSRILLTGVAAAALAVLLAPGLVAHRSRLRADRELRAFAMTSAVVARSNMDLQSSTGALDEVARFADSKRPMLRLLGSVSLALPESTAIASLRVDSVGGALVLVSAAGPALVTPLARVDAFTNVQLTGTVTREAIGPVDLQRLTMRFRHVRKKRLSP